MDACFDFLNMVYGTFGFEFQLKLSTRPEKYLGKLEQWDEAERVSIASAQTPTSECHSADFDLALNRVDAVCLARQICAWKMGHRRR